jgi:hypothetical protein
MHAIVLPWNAWMAPMHRKLLGAAAIDGVLGPVYLLENLIDGISGSEFSVLLSFHRSPTRITPIASFYLQRFQY